MPSNVHRNGRRQPLWYTLLFPVALVLCRRGKMCRHNFYMLYNCLVMSSPLFFGGRQVRAQRTAPNQNVPILYVSYYLLLLYQSRGDCAVWWNWLSALRGSCFLSYHQRWHQMRFYIPYRHEYSGVSIWYPILNTKRREKERKGREGWSCGQSPKTRLTNMAGRWISSSCLSQSPSSKSKLR